MVLKIYPTTSDWSVQYRRHRVERFPTGSRDRKYGQPIDLVPHMKVKYLIQNKNILLFIKRKIPQKYHERISFYMWGKEVLRHRLDDKIPETSIYEETLSWLLLHPEPFTGDVARTIRISELKHFSIEQIIKMRDKERKIKDEETFQQQMERTERKHEAWLANKKVERYKRAHEVVKYIIDFSALDQLPRDILLDDNLLNDIIKIVAE